MCDAPSWGSDTTNYNTPSQSDPMGESEPDPGCSDSYKLINLSLFIHIMLNI